jgi:hypothetical protein
MSRYLDTLDEKVPQVGKRWTNEWLPMIRSRNEAERTADYSGMSNAELLAKFDDMTEWMTQMWYVHGHINFALVSGAALSDLYTEVMQPEDPTEAYQILQGYHTRPVDAAHGLWDLSRVVRNSPTLHAMFDETHPRDLAAKLATTDEGREFLERLDTYLFDFGWRSDAVYDIADVPWRENPQIPLGAIARYINMGDETIRCSSSSAPSSCAKGSSRRSAPSLPTIPTSSPGSRSCTRRRSTRCRSPRTTRSTSTRWVWCCCARSCSLSARPWPATA